MEEKIYILKENELEPLGINSSGAAFLNLNKNQNHMIEWIKTNWAIREYINKLNQINPNQKIKCQYINYGDTQLVYVLTVDDKKYALLINQPNIKKEEVSEEFKNLQYLYEKNSDIIVKPIDVFTYNDSTLYIADYEYQARCIASFNNDWGIYIPEPSYRFEPFYNDEERKNVNSSMVANLIRLYDEEKKLGLASCRIGGGDFILQKDWSSSTKTLEETMSKMKLIAARKLINITLYDYINIIRKEFVLSTYNKNSDESILINHKSRIPMDKFEIEQGIQMGLEYRTRNRK